METPHIHVIRITAHGMSMLLSRISGLRKKKGVNEGFLVKLHHIFSIVFSIKST
jgi:hypothetical protein